MFQLQTTFRIAVAQVAVDGTNVPKAPAPAEVLWSVQEAA